MSASAANPTISDVRVERIPQASHWVQADAPERVGQLVLDFLALRRR
jgi:pimeloyl-ACP methyl ester carboxylesterase